MQSLLWFDIYACKKKAVLRPGIQSNINEESNGIKSRGRFMEITEENAIEELCEQQKGNTNQSPAPEDF